MAYRECPGCGWWYVADDEDYCPECGWLVPHKCPFCGYEYTGRLTYCVRCRRKISAYPREIWKEDEIDEPYCPSAHNDLEAGPPQEKREGWGCLLIGLVLAVFGTFVYLTGTKGFTALCILFICIWGLKKL